MWKSKEHIEIEHAQYQLFRKCKLRSQWYATTHLLDWLKLKRLNIWNVIKNVEELEVSFSVGGNIIGTLENNLAVP